MFVQLDEVLPLGLICKNGSQVPTTPDAAPTYAIYGPVWEEALKTGSLGSSDKDSVTGFRTGTYTVSANDGFATGKCYTIVYEYELSSTEYKTTATFMVI